MKKLLIYFTIVMIISGIFPMLASSVPSKSEDCIICGHACCCPEMCAPKIKELKKKQAESHCSVEQATHSATKGCDQPVSMCKLSSNDPVAVVFNRETILINPQQGILTLIRPGNRKESESLLEARLSIISPRFQEIPTPPPRSA